MKPRSIQKDEMTPRQRIDSFKKGESIDRIPCSPMIAEYACRFIGEKVSRYLHSAKVMARSQVEAFKVFGYDSVGVSPDHYGLAEAMGSLLIFPTDDRPQLAKPFIGHPRDVEKVEPVDPEICGRLPLYLEALEMINEEIGDYVKVGSGIGGPFTAAALLRGPDNFLKDLHRDPELVHAILRQTTESIKNYMEACFKRGCSCSLGDALASSDVISPDHFREFAQPYLKEIAAWVKQRTGSGPSLHICGKTAPIWLDMVETGVVQISLDEKEGLEEARHIMGSRVAIKGNVPPVSVLLNGSPQQVIASARDCIRKAGSNPRGFILSSGCTVPLDTPPANIHALMDAARTLGRCPIELGRFD